jgi:hypothetical protein
MNHIDWQTNRRRPRGVHYAGVTSLGWPACVFGYGHVHRHVPGRWSGVTTVATIPNRPI